MKPDELVNALEDDEALEVYFLLEKRLQPLSMMSNTILVEEKLIKNGKRGMFVKQYRWRTGFGLLAVRRFYDYLRLKLKKEKPLICG